MSETNDRLVREFYRLLSGGDGGAMRKFVTANFVETASVTWPESHPRAGVVSGRERLEKLFSRIAAGPPIRGGVNFQVIDILAREDAAAARITFEWVGRNGEHLPNGALEWWVFDTDGLVSAIVPYYWDGHAVATRG
jgi:hypothetical protein